MQVGDPGCLLFRRLLKTHLKSPPPESVRGASHRHLSDTGRTSSQASRRSSVQRFSESEGVEGRHACVGCGESIDGNKNLHSTCSLKTNKEN